MKRIDFETHFATEEWVDALFTNDGYPRLVEDADTGNRRLYYMPETGEPWGEVISGGLLDLGEGRVKEMDATGIDVAVISLTSPGVEQLRPDVAKRLARSTNDALANAIAKYPERFQGFAALPTREPEEAVRELERAVKELKLKGWKTHSNFGDSYLDEKRYWPVLAKAEELDVPIYLHPAVPAIPEFRTYGISMAGAAFGFGAETAMTMMRLIYSGALDAFPRLRIILGHYGEALPFLMQRMDFPYIHAYHQSDTTSTVPLARKPSDYFRRNVWVSTSGNYLPAAFTCTREALGMQRIVLGTDHPYESMAESLAFLDGLGLSEEEERGLYFENGVQLGF